MMNTDGILCMMSLQKLHSCLSSPKRSIAGYVSQFFQDFIQYCVLANWKRDHIMNQHWSPVVESCKVCDSYYHRFDFYSTYWFLE